MKWCTPTRNITILVLIVSGLLSSCNKLLDPGLPSDKTVTETVYSNDSSAQAALIYIYTDMMRAFDLHNGFMSKYGGIQSDELIRTAPSEADQPFLTNSLSPNDQVIKQVWNSAYAYIAQANNVLEGLTNATGVSQSMRDQLMGEAYFLRALTYFYLVNLYGAVPLVVTTDYKRNAVMPRTSTDVIYRQLIADLQQAQALLPIKYYTTPANPKQRVRANKMAATALLARVYLYNRQWQPAAAAAAEVIHSNEYQLEPVEQTFLCASREAILQLLPVNTAYNTAEGAYFVPIMPNPNTKPAYIMTEPLLKSFEAGDARTTWIRIAKASNQQYHSPYKFTVPLGPEQKEYNIVLRLAEQYLIHAEASAMQNQLPQAIADLNSIRTRAGLPAIDASASKATVLLAIEQERRIELFAEWGHRWFDLKRTPAILPSSLPSMKRIDEVMGVVRSTTWKITSALWPIPGEQLIKNHFLTQNPGY
jgi:starch-binding outer membrane protein, SusD/RagB family